jgi:hypothetical protein
MNSFNVESLWQPFTSATGKFTVKLPLAPIATDEVTKYQGKTTQWTKFEAKNLYAKDDSYIVAYNDLPSQSATKP